MSDRDCPVTPKKSLAIGLYAYECAGNMVFVRVPNERGRWLLTDRCVVEVDCPICNSVSGEPCKNQNSDTLRYWTGTHARRRELFRNYTGKPKPKIRMSLTDIQDARSDAP